MRLQEPRVLADNVHDIGRNHGLVVLSALDLAKAEQVFDDSNQEALLGLLVCGNFISTKKLSPSPR